MRRRWKVTLGVLAALAVLLTVNTIVVDDQTKSAAVTVAGGEIVEVPGGAVQVVDEGPTQAGPRAAGQPIVLLHCYACSLRWYDRVAKILARRHRVVRIDLLGHGGSEKPSSGYSIPDQAGAVGAALNALGVEGAAVVGNSMGAAVAIALADQASQLTDRVVVLDFPPDYECCGDLSFTSKLLRQPVIGEALWRVKLDSLVKADYEQSFAPGFDLEAGFDDPDQVVEDLDAMTFTSYRETTLGTRDYVEELPLDERLTQAAVPAMVAFGADDQVFDPDEALAAYEDVPGVRLETIDGAGHAPHVERPKETAAMIEEFALGASVRVRKPSSSRTQADR